MGQLTVNIGGVPQITLSINEAAVFETIERRFTAYAAKMHVTPSRCATEIIVARTQSVSTTGRSWHGPNSRLALFRAQPSGQDAAGPTQGVSALL